MLQLLQSWQQHTKTLFVLRTREAVLQIQLGHVRLIQKKSCGDKDKVLAWMDIVDDVVGEPHEKSRTRGGHDT